MSWTQDRCSRKVDFAPGRKFERDNPIEGGFRWFRVLWGARLADPTETSALAALDKKRGAERPVWRADEDLSHEPSPDGRGRHSGGLKRCYCSMRSPSSQSA